MKFLTDNQVPNPLVQLLRKNDWDVLSVHDPEVGLQHEKKDARIVAWANVHDRVVVSMDTFFRAGVWLEIINQIKNQGGKVITLGGGPQQGIDRAFGLLFFHRTDWNDKLSVEDGWYQIHTPTRGGARWQSRSDFIGGAPELEKRRFTDIDDYIIDLEYRRDEARKKPRPRQRPSPRPDQASIDFDSLNRRR